MMNTIVYGLLLCALAYVVHGNVAPSCLPTEASCTVTANCYCLNGFSLTKFKKEWARGSAWGNKLKCDPRTGQLQDFPDLGCKIGRAKGQSVVISQSSSTTTTTTNNNNNNDKNDKNDGNGNISEENKNTCLDDANSYRRKHRNTPILEWDNQLASDAQNWANEMLKDKFLRHDDSATTVGENLYYSSASGGSLESDGNICKNANKNWYNEIDDYNWYSPDSMQSLNGKAVGHFTQMVWKNSQKVGYGVATERVGEQTYVYVCARYSPPGNYENQYSANVLQLNKRKDENVEKVDKFVNDIMKLAKEIAEDNIDDTVV